MIFICFLNKNITLVIIYTKWVIFFLGSSLRQIRAVRRRAELSSFLKLGWEDRDNKFLLVIVYAHTVDCVFRQL